MFRLLQAYTIMMKRAGPSGSETANGGAMPAAVIERRYSDFCFIYECILRSFHPSVLGDFLFPKKARALADTQFEFDRAFSYQKTTK